MTPNEIRAAVRGLQTQGHSLREISRLLAMSRNTVRRILREPAGDVGGEPPPCGEATLIRLKGAFARARGNVVRVRELLADEGLEVPYSTLTRWVRDADLRGPPRRAGEYDFAPGQEMQHDTSPHRAMIRCSTVRNTARSTANSNLRSASRSSITDRQELSRHSRSKSRGGPIRLASIVVVSPFSMPDKSIP